MTNNHSAVSLIFFLFQSTAVCMLCMCACRQHLQNLFDVVSVVNVFDSNDTDNLELLSRPELGVTFTKLHCWRLTQFSKCVFMDADTLVNI